MSFYVAGVQSVPGVIFHVPGVLQTTGAQAIGKSVSQTFLSLEDV